jgi:Polysaccharide pyruvyl transferase
MTLKVALFNDTSRSGFGCDAVMETIRSSITERNGDLFYTHKVGRPWKDERTALEAVEATDIVIVNGEGTIHHGSGDTRPNARWLAEVGPYCKARGKPCYLINSTIEKNDASLMEALASFSGIWVRESLSRNEVESFGMTATAMGDLSLCQLFERSSERRGEVLVTDSASKAMTKDLWKLSQKLKTKFVSLEYKNGGPEIYRNRFIQRKVFRRRDIEGVSNFREFSQFLSGYDYVVTGRFHALCMAIALRVPVSVGETNSWKSIGMLADIGLDPRRQFGVGQVPARLAFSDEEITRIDAYLERTRQSAQDMFDKVLGRQAVSPSTAATI